MLEKEIGNCNFNFYYGDMSLEEMVLLYGFVID